MPGIKDTIADVAGSLANAEPAVQISNGIAKVGEIASGAYTNAKNWVGAKLATTPPPGDIELFKEKKKSRPVTRSLSKR
jgi:hypothetical protein